MSLADTNIGSMVATKVEEGKTQSKVEGTNEVDAPKQQTEPVKQPDHRQLKSFDVIARKERAIMREKQAIAQEKAQIMEQIQALEKWKQEKAQLETLKQQYKTNPAKLLEDHGLSYNDLAEFQLNDKTPTPQMLIRQQQERIDALEQRLQDKEAKQQEEFKRNQAQQEVEVVEDFKDQIRTFVKSKPDEYEYIHINEAENLVYDIIEEYYTATSKNPENEGRGKIMPIKVAADKVEKYLTDIVESKILSAKKLQSKLASKTQPKEEAPQSPRTLSNSITTTSAPYTGISARNEQDRLARAMAKLEGR